MSRAQRLSQTLPGDAWLVALSVCVAACGPKPSPPDACRAGPARLVSDRPAVVLNAYYLQEEATRALRSGATDSAVLEEVLGKAATLGAAAVRTNAFNDDPAKAGDSAIQVAKLQYDEVALRGLDLVLARARAHGLRLVLPLGNYWNDYGGTRQYATWAGLAAPHEGDERFFTERAVIDHYTQHVTTLLNRVSTADGLRYGEHPAVLAWEILNEPRGRGLDPDGAQMRAWVDEVAATVKRLAPAHLVSTGEEGLEVSAPQSDAAFWAAAAPASGLFGGGSSFALNLASPFVDLGSVHLYPEAWGVPLAQVAEAGARWLSQHAEAAWLLSKPLLLGEFGLRNDGLALDDRRAIYREWFACTETAGLAGAGPWLFANDSRPDAWDVHTFYFLDGTDPADPRNRYADIVLETARNH